MQTTEAMTANHGETNAKVFVGTTSKDHSFGYVGDFGVGESCDVAWINLH